MKMQKFNLSQLKVKSFITSVEAKDQQTVEGGSKNWSLVLCEGTISLATCPIEETNEL